MANTANTQQNKGHDTVKNVKSVLLTTRELQQSLAEVKKQAVALSDLIQKRKTEFLRKEAESLAEIQATENIIVESPVIEEVPDHPVDNAEPAITVEQRQKEDIAEDKKPVIKADSTPAAEKNIEDSQPKTKVVTTIENGREVKTYTDEKGNVKIRKFLDLSAANKPQNQRPRQTNDSRINSGVGTRNDQ